MNAIHNKKLLNIVDIVVSVVVAFSVFSRFVNGNFRSIFDISMNEINMNEIQVF